MWYDLLTALPLSRLTWIAGYYAKTELKQEEKQKKHIVIVQPVRIKNMQSSIRAHSSANESFSWALERR